MINGNRSHMENEMEISQIVMNEAVKLLRFEGVSDLPKQIGQTPLFVGKKDDPSIISYGVIEFEGVEYKVGPKRSS